MSQSLERCDRPEGTLFVLRPAGSGRFVAAAFMLFWLAGWAAGELGALALLFGRFLPASLARHLPKLGQVPWPAAAFLLLWLALWTLGGLAALFATHRLLAGRDEVLLRGDGLVLSAGWLGRGRREVSRGEMSGLEIRSNGGALVLHLRDGKTVSLSSLGTLEDRAALREEIRARYGIAAPEEAADLVSGGLAGALPKGWEAVPEPTGEWTLGLDAKARRQAAGCLLTLAALGTVGLAFWESSQGWWRAEPLSLAFLGGALTTLFAGTAILALALLGFAREELRVSPNRLEIRKRFGPWRWSRTLVGGTLVVSSHVDSDGDEWGRLDAVTPDGRRKVWGGTEGRATAVLLGRFLAARSGWRLETSG